MSGFRLTPIASPGRTRRAPNRDYRAMLEGFIESGDKCAQLEIEWPNGGPMKGAVVAVGEQLRWRAKRMQLPVTAYTKGQNIYLERTDL